MIVDWLFLQLFGFFFKGVVDVLSFNESILKNFNICVSLDETLLQFIVFLVG